MLALFIVDIIQATMTENSNDCNGDRFMDRATGDCNMCSDICRAISIESCHLYYCPGKLMFFLFVKIVRCFNRFNRLSSMHLLTNIIQTLIPDYEPQPTLADDSSQGQYILKKINLQPRI